MVRIRSRIGLIRLEVILTRLALCVHVLIIVTGGIAKAIINYAFATKCRLLHKQLVANE